MADFVTGDDLDDLFIAIEEDLFWEDEEFKSDLNKSVTELSSLTEIRCSLCEKVYKTSGGLDRHMKSKHGGTVTTKVPVPVVSCRFDSNDFAQLLSNSLEKLKGNEGALA